MKVHLINRITEIAIFAMFHSTWQGRVWAYGPH